MKKVLIILGSVIAVIAILIGVFIINTGKSLHKAVEDAAEMEDIDMEQIADGVYTGEKSISPVSVIVEVTVKNHEIEKIDLVKHNNGKGKPAEAMLDTMIENNTSDVDAVSGATLSSVVIEMAVHDALLKGTN